MINTMVPISCYTGTTHAHTDYTLPTKTDNSSCIMSVSKTLGTVNNSRPNAVVSM